MNNDEAAASRAQVERIWKGLLIAGGVALLMCCGFATFLVVRLT